MTSASQVVSGRAFEYAIARALQQVSGAEIEKGTVSDTALAAYRLETRSSGMDTAAWEAAKFLDSCDTRIREATLIQMQPDKAGATGDVRDIVMCCGKEQIGISAKQNHDAVKHSRLSSSIDFGKRWADIPVSDDYWKQIKPIFAELSDLKEQKALFRDIKNKDARIYLPVLTAFEDEFKRLCEKHAQKFIEPVFKYLIGRHDFYKIVGRPKDKEVRVQSYNLNGSLKWGWKWKIPTHVVDVSRQPRSLSTLRVTLEGGWLIKFRLHSARSKVEPSLKFDIRLAGMPSEFTSHQIPLDARNSVDVCDRSAEN